MQVTILTEDWFTGYIPKDEAFVVDAEFELDDEERDEYGMVLADEKLNALDTLAYLQRDEDDSSILLRWNQPPDVLDELEQIELNDERAVWTERMTAFRETQLRRLLKEYFGGDDYMEREIVLRWEQKNGRWVPGEKMKVAAWVAKTIEERGTRLAAFASCAGFLRSRITRKRIARDATGQAGGWRRTYESV